MDIIDNGPNPNAFNIEEATVEKTRTTARSCGRAATCRSRSCRSPWGSRSALEVHDENDQFLRIEAGEGRCVIGAERIS